MSTRNFKFICALLIISILYFYFLPLPCLRITNYINILFYKNLRQIRQSNNNIKQKLSLFYEQRWKEAVGRSGFDQERMKRFSDYFQGNPIEPVIKSNLNGATLVITIPEYITFRIEEFKTELYVKLKNAIFDLDSKFYMTPADALHSTILVTERFHEGDLSEDAFSDKSILTIKEITGYTKPFKLEINGVNLTSNGVIILECYVEDETIFNLRDRLRKNLDFVPEKRHSQEIIHITLGRFLKNVTEEEFNKIIGIISEYRNFNFGSFMVNQLLYSHLKAFGLEGRLKEQDIIINLERE